MNTQLDLKGLPKAAFLFILDETTQKNVFLYVNGLLNETPSFDRIVPSQTQQFGKKIALTL